MPSGMIVPTLFGIAGFVLIGLGTAWQCSVSWIGHGGWICGGVFIVMAPVGYFAGLAVFWLLRGLFRVLVGRTANP